MKCFAICMCCWGQAKNIEAVSPKASTVAFNEGLSLDMVHLKALSFHLIIIRLGFDNTLLLSFLFVKSLANSRSNFR